MLIPVGVQSTLATPCGVKRVTGVSYVDLVPRITEFYGFTVLMFFGDHNPPHFHVRYAGHGARVALDGRILAGSLARWEARLVAEWAGFHPLFAGLCRALGLHYTAY